MFFTPEPVNAYSLELQEPPKTKAKKKTSKKSLTTNGSTHSEEESQPLYLTALLGFQSQKGYDRMGSSITASLTKPLPHFAPEMGSFFAEGAYVLATKPLRDSLNVTQEKKVSLLGIYGGYYFQLNEKTILKPKLGVAFFTQPQSNLSLAYGASAVRKITLEEVDLVGEIIIIKDLWIMSAGVRYALPMH